MEEHAGLLWHRLVTRAAERRHPGAAVALEQVARGAGILFRALGGEPGLTLKAASATAHGARRSVLQRIAGSGARIELAWRDGESLCLPAVIDLLPDPALNRDLYLWLAALAAVATPSGPWFQANQQAALRLFRRFPGMEARYRRLLAPMIALRPDPQRLPPDQAAAERAIRAALHRPGSQSLLPPTRRPPFPVHLWLHPQPPLATGAARGGGPGEGGRAGRTTADRRRRRAEQVALPERQDGLLMPFRAENVLTWAEFVRVNRPTEEDDPGSAHAADDLDVLSVTRDGETVAARLRFDLDLPSAAADDAPLGEGILLPEWHYKKQRLQPAHCRLQPMVARHAAPAELPARLRRSARRIKAQFAALASSRTWLDRQYEGSEPDLDAWVEYAAERRRGAPVREPGLYRAQRARRRDLACLLLADVSLSTDAFVDDDARVIDVVRDSLFLFSEALSGAGDRFALYAFSSLRRDNVRFHHIKGFDEPYGGRVRGRVGALKPGYYTRMGAALRHASALLARQPCAQRLLLLLTDGKPNDLDQYEGRYGVEDTREALAEARRMGLRPFCVTIDERAADYLPHLFGGAGYLVIRKPSELPARLPLLYAQLTR